MNVCRLSDCTGHLCEFNKKIIYFNKNFFNLTEERN